MMHRITYEITFIGGSYPIEDLVKKIDEKNKEIVSIEKISEKCEDGREIFAQHNSIKVNQN